MSASNTTQPAKPTSNTTQPAKPTSNTILPAKEIKSDLPVVTTVGLFILSVWMSILPATTFVYYFFETFNPISEYLRTGQLWIPIVWIVLGFCIAYVVLLASAWCISKLTIFILMKGKPLAEGRFEKSFKSPEFKQFTFRHLLKQFSMWLFRHHAPRWLYRKYIGTFIKLGKHVEIPEWVPMELTEIGDNTVFAKQVAVTGHVIEGNTVTFKRVKIGKNCIIDATDNTAFICIGPGAVIKDNTILKPGTLIPKDMPLEEGGIYQGDFVVDRIGNVSDIPPAELEAYRKEVRNRKLKSKMLDDWSAFHSSAPRVIVGITKIAGLIIGIGLLLLYWLYVIPAINMIGVLGTVMNLTLLPLVCLLVYGIHLYVPLFIAFFGMKHYEKQIPVLDDKPDATVEITDPAIIEAWRSCKWLKWQIVNRVIRSFLNETVTVLYQHIGKNKIATKSAFFEAIVDTDYVSIGENTLLSCDCHVYGYTLVEQPSPKLILKRTSIGANTIVARSNIFPGTCIGDNVMIGAHSVIEKDSVFESGKLYAGAPAKEWKEFLQVRKVLKAKAKNPVS